MEAPLLSIVIANYNYGRFLEDAIKSVLNQCCHNVELIIIDGGSTDNSIEVIKKYTNGLPPKTYRPNWRVNVQQRSLEDQSQISYWVSEKDRGQSHAFNKGFAVASGQFLTWLNADDVMASDAIDKLVRAVDKFPMQEWFIGGCCWLDGDLNVVRCSRARPLSRIRADAGNIQAYGPSSFFSRKLFERAGGNVDERFHYMMDIELWNRFYHKTGANYVMLPGYVWGFRMHPGAKTSGQRFADSEMSKSEHPSWAKKRAEEKLNAEMYCKYRMTMLRRIVSISPLPWLMGWVDTFRMKGKKFSA